MVWAATPTPVSPLRGDAMTNAGVGGKHGATVTGTCTLEFPGSASVKVAEPAAIGETITDAIEPPLKVPRATETIVGSLTAADKLAIDAPPAVTWID